MTENERVLSTSETQSQSQTVSTTTGETRLTCRDDGVTYRPGPQRVVRRLVLGSFIASSSHALTALCRQCQILPRHLVRRPSPFIISTYQLYPALFSLSFATSAGHTQLAPGVLPPPLPPFFSWT